MKRRQFLQAATAGLADIRSLFPVLWPGWDKEIGDRYTEGKRHRYQVVGIELADPVPVVGPFSRRAIPTSKHVSPDFAKDNHDASERLSEIAEILAAGLTRLEARKSSPNPTEFGESSLHFSPDQSGGVPPCSAEASHD